jgi:hypothetical protein
MIRIHRLLLWRPLILPLFLLPFLSGCRGDGGQSEPSLVLEVGISPTPPSVGPARLIISLHDTSGAPIPGADIAVEGNMSHAGMTPVLATAQEVAPGQYSVPEFVFTMAGDWFLILRATLPDGRSTHIQQGTDVTGQPGGDETDEGRSP